MIPYNRVHASALQADLAREFSKQTWREATRDALARWLAEGHAPECVPTAARGRRAPRYTYTED